MTVTVAQLSLLPPLCVNKNNNRLLDIYMEAVSEPQVFDARPSPTGTIRVTTKYIHIIINRTRMYPIE